MRQYGEQFPQLVVGTEGRHRVVGDRRVERVELGEQPVPGSEECLPVVDGGEP